LYQLKSLRSLPDKYQALKDDFLLNKLEERKAANAFRQLLRGKKTIDFCSNDYLGIVHNDLLFKGNEENNWRHGSTGSRLLSGNYALIEETEQQIAAFHLAESALIFNSGYDANLGLLSCIAKRGDTILYDFLSHASIRDGIRLSLAASFSFIHNDIEDLEKKLKNAKGKIFVVTESVFSMDGDFAPLKEISNLCAQYDAALIVDEAHATGVIGERGEGLVQMLGMQQDCLARIHTFGKACGVHGAVILGSKRLKDYLVNFSRAFIYTTALPESSVAAIAASYNVFPILSKERNHLSALISNFSEAQLPMKKLISATPIQGVIIPGNENAKSAAALLQENNMDVRAILYPTVPAGEERLRIVLHSFNTGDELTVLINTLLKYYQNQ
jgi:8-amino-7-oxononanoate synthase